MNFLTGSIDHVLIRLYWDVTNNLWVNGGSPTGTYFAPTSVTTPSPLLVSGGGDREYITA
jgi:hypothetical protein